jgi:uncharacterized repeat protein (TIGR03803 family)
MKNKGMSVVESFLKVRFGRSRILTMVSLLSLFAFAAQAGAQEQRYNLKQLSGSSELSGNTEKAHHAKIKNPGPDFYTYSVLYTFCSVANCADGSEPSYGTLTQDSAGNVYGTTKYGGTNNSGTVFKVTPAGHETVLYSFCSATNCTDGSNPMGGLIWDAGGNLYGTTTSGGTHNDGTVFKLLAGSSWTETVLYSFKGGSDGAGPADGVIWGAYGWLFGTTSGGGSGDAGTVFRLEPPPFSFFSPWTETVIHSFCSAPNCTDGMYPYAGVTDVFGILYGTTQQGGTYQGSGNQGNGVLYQIYQDGSGFNVLYNFCSLGSCADGFFPMAGVIQDPSGDLYGTTVYGGAGVSGTVFEFNTSGQESVVHSFDTLGDGEVPQGGPLLMDGSGNLYGTTFQGGAHGTGNGGDGIVFEVDSSGNESVLYNFCSQANCADGEFPDAGLIEDATGNLYGTTLFGGSSDPGCIGQGCGVVFKLSRVCALCAVVNPNILYWEKVPIGKTGGIKYVKLTNQGSQTLDISSIEITGNDASQFVVVPSKKSPCGSTLAAGATCLIGANFDPTQTGLQTATITITDNAQNSPQTVSLSGTGVQ